MSQRPTRAGPAAVPAPARRLPARRLGGRYLLDQIVGSVSGARVWRGTDAVLNRTVILWELPDDRAVSAEVAAAVLGAARLTDPRIARILDADCAAARPYVVTEWVRGRSLQYLLGVGLPDPLTAVTIAVEAAEALAAAHEAGPSHLRLAPASVRCTETGLKITGLGIEAALSGTVAVDPARTDTGALAGLLYALLTGYWPGPDPCRLPRAPRYRGETCAPGEVRSGVPAMLDEIAIRVLRPGHARPISSPAQLARELRQARRALRPLGRRPADPVGQQVAAALLAVGSDHRQA